MSVKNFLFLLLLLFPIYTFAQQEINYGSNAAAGKYYNIRGINIYCEVYGSGKPLLLIHGNGGSIGAFKNNIAFFAKRYKVIVVDSRSQGKSTDTGDSLSFEMMADDFDALLTAMGIDSAYVLGWSDGGINALLLAMRHPDKVIKLASTGANLWPDSTAIVPDDWKEEQAYYDSSRRKVWATAAEKNAWKLFMLDWLQPNVPLTALKSIKCPSLIIAGDRDVITLEHTVQIYKNIPKANLWILPYSGHATLVQYKEEFNNKVAAFFSSKAL